MENVFFNPVWQAFLVPGLLCIESVDHTGYVADEEPVTITFQG